MRGAMFAKTVDYTAADIDALTGFLGHHCDLNYGDVSEALRRTLPPAPTATTRQAQRKKRRKAKVRRKRRGPSREGDTCYRCGKTGHWATDCPSNKKGEVGDKGTAMGEGLLASAVRVGGGWDEDRAMAGAEAAVLEIPGSSGHNATTTTMSGKDEHDRPIIRARSQNPMFRSANRRGGGGGLGGAKTP